jgi:WD40 repeat protein
MWHWCHVLLQRLNERWCAAEAGKLLVLTVAAVLLVAGIVPFLVKRNTSTRNDVRNLTREHPGLVGGITFSADGRALAAANRRPVITLWDVQTGKGSDLYLGSAETGYLSVAFSRDGNRIAAGGFDGNKPIVSMWDVNSRKLIHHFSDPDGGVAIAFSPAGDSLAIGGKGLTVWDTHTLNKKLALRGPDSPSFAGPVADPKMRDDATWTSVAFSPDGKQLVGGGWLQLVALWEMPSGVFQGVLPGPPKRNKELPGLPLSTATAQAHVVVFSPDGRLLATAGSDELIHLWNSRNREYVRTLVADAKENQPGHQKNVQTLVFSPDGRCLASGGLDGSVILWDPRAGDYQRNLVDHRHPVTALAFAPDGLTLASAGYNEIKLWSIK